MFYWLGGENGKQMLRWKTHCFIGWEVRMGNRCYGGRHVVLLVWRREWETDVTVENTFFIGWEVKMGNRRYGERHVVLLVWR